LKNTQSLTVSNLKQETLNSVVVSFKVPPSLKNQYTFKAGQYLTLSSNINGEKIKRSYSICSSPQSQNLQVGVKAIENGVFSNYVNDALREGDSIEVSIPEGRFVLENNTQANYCAFVAGSGITPLMSIISDVLEHNENSVFVLGYGNKTKASTMFSSAINELKSRYPKRFFYYNIYSQENNSEANFGRIDSSFINYVLKQHPQISFEKILLCGPENMIENSKDTLEKLNYPDSKVLYELFFSKSVLEKDNEKGNGSTAKIIYDEEILDLNVPEKMTILDAALQKNIDVPYSCQGGVCSSCIAKITSGSATMIQNNILTDSEIEEGLVLTCQAVPETKEITVDFDDV
jgi:ring-1,2-phenylacetyl-CoA epoxidase subunit PaaE